MSFVHEPMINNNPGSEDLFLLETLDAYLAEINYREEYKKDKIIRDMIFYYNMHIEGNYDLYNELKEYEKKLSQPYSDLLNRFFIVYLYKKNINLIDNLQISETVKNYIYDDFKRILNILKNKKPFSYTYVNYIYYSYIRVMLFQRFPVGVVNLDISFYCRSVFFKQPFKDKVAFVKYFIISKGSRPFFQMHYNPHKLRKFNREGWREAITLTGELLESMPMVKGVCGSAWFFDPALETISPELCYIREQFESFGGKLFFNGCSEEDKVNALARSKKRRDAFRGGIYKPTNYLMILPGSTLLKKMRSMDL